MESDGFWLFLIAQIAAASPLSDTLGMTGHKRLVLLVGLAFSLLAAFFMLLYGYGGISNESARALMRWLILFPMAASLLATSAAAVMPRTFAKK